MARCFDCEAPETKEKICPTELPTDCYEYNEHDHYALDKDQCFKAKCKQKNDAPKSKVIIGLK